MSEAGEMPQGVEVQESPVVAGARKAVQKVLGVHDEYKRVRETLEAPKKPSVYREWVNAADKVIAAMTPKDREKWTTGLYKAKMVAIGGALHLSTGMLDLAWNTISIPFRTVAEMGFFSKYLGRLITSPFSKFEVGRARQHATEKVLGYEAKLAPQVAKRVVEDKVKGILTGFAYPEGKPAKPPMAKV